MAECACKCHEHSAEFHCYRCYEGTKYEDTACCAAADIETFNRTMQAQPLSPIGPDLTEMWARVFEEGVKNG